MTTYTFFRQIIIPKIVKETEGKTSYSESHATTGENNLRRILFAWAEKANKMPVAS